MSNDQKIREPHLIDVGSIADVAQWIALTAIAGIIGNAADTAVRSAADNMLNSVRRRFGRSRVRDVESKVLELVSETKTQSDLSAEEIEAKVRDLFKDFR